MEAQTQMPFMDFPKCLDMFFKIVLATLLFISDLFIALSLVLDNTVAYTEFFYSFFSDVFELDAEIYGHF